MKSIELNNDNLLPFKDLLKGIQRLDIGALEAFADELNRLISKRKKQPQNDREAELIRIIKEHIPPSIRRRQKELYEILRSGNITVREKEELELLNNMLEEKSAERIHFMGELAALKKTDLPELIEHFDLRLMDGQA